VVACVGAPQTIEDQRNLKLEDYVDPAHLASTRPAVPVPSTAGRWGLLGNSHVGDCAFAAAGHAEQVWAAPEHPDPPVTSTAVTEAYAQAKQKRPAAATPHPAHAGMPVLDALNYWRNFGVAGHQIDAFAAVKPYDVDWVRFAIDRFGFAYAVLALPDAVVPSGMTPSTAPPWSALPQGPDRAMNVSNSHCVIYVAYDAEMTLTAITWGRTMPTAWDFHGNYIEELYVALSPSASAPAGVDVASWKRDAAQAGQS
jgi:hypothetical protein